MHFLYLYISMVQHYIFTHCVYSPIGGVILASFWVPFLVPFDILFSISTANIALGRGRGREGSESQVGKQRFTWDSFMQMGPKLDRQSARSVVFQ